MTREQKEKLANAYNTLSTLIPIPSEEFSEKHYTGLFLIRSVLLEVAEDEKSNGS